VIIATANRGSLCKADMAANRVRTPVRGAKLRGKPWADTSRGFPLPESSHFWLCLLRCEIGHSLLNAQKRKLNYHRLMSNKAPVAECFKTPA
jgi:hypothetical protein